MAKHSGGEFVLRIEDTDKKREVEGAKEKILETLKLFGLEWDEYYVQSERVETGIYLKAAQSLVEKGKAFYCQCKPKNAKEEGFSKQLRDPCRDKGLTSGAIKLKVKDGEGVSYTDFVLGKEISWDTSLVADATLLKSDGFPTYHLAFVVDDWDMKISHVLRGHDWMPSTPIHLLVYKYLGWEVPEIGHLTDILDPEGGKLSKRKGSTSCEGILAEGYLPEAVLNFIMLLGWAPKDNREVYSLKEFVKAFDADGFQKSNPIFDRGKLDWFNGHYLRQNPDDKLTRLVWEFLGKKYPESAVAKTTPLVRERMAKLSDYWPLAGFLFEERTPPSGLFGKNKDEHLGKALEELEILNKWEKESIDKALLEVVAKNSFKTGDFFMDLRIAVTGSKFTPPINDSIALMDKKEVLSRIRKTLGEKSKK